VHAESRHCLGRANGSVVLDYVEPTDGFDKAGWTILHAAVRRRNLEEARVALDARIDPNNNATDEELWTPLWVAACYGQSAITRLLLRAGAHANAVARDGSTAVREAAMIGSTEVLTLLIAAGADLELCHSKTRDTPLIRAAAKGHPEAVTLLLEAGADVNAQQVGGWSALHYALQSRNEGLALMILQYSPNHNISIVTGVKPLHLAAIYR